VFGLDDAVGGRGLDELADYRALYATDSGDYKAFRVVPGATIAGSAAAGTETVALATDIEIEGASFSYEREVAVTDGQFRVTVPYPGTYELEGASVDSVTVGEDAVQSGGEVAASG
jgi:dolichyl-diphosphooligosaccharide--protein glycosyltransferase